MADQFSRLARRQDPQLAVLFANHVASAMHRYWPASFPDDWDDEIYDARWRDTYRHEIPFALNALDQWLERWMTWCEATDRTMIVLSSMGQRGGAEVDTSKRHAVVVDNAARFAETLGLDPDAQVGRAMVPQISYRFQTASAAELNESAVIDRFAGSPGVHIDRAGDTLTITYDGLSAEGDKVEIGDRWFSSSEAGVRIHEVNEHRAAVHDPLGTIVVFNSATADIPDSPVDYLRIAPAILEFLGVEPLAHHQESGFTI